MFTKYNKYKEIDFLTDDYFVESMLEPTPESDAFWKVLIDDAKIDENEFISAYMTLKHLHNSKPNAPAGRIDDVWNRISETNRKKKTVATKRKLLKFSLVACGMVGVIILSFSLIFNNNTSPSIADFAEETIFNTQPATDQIQLVSGKETMELDGTEANVEYDKNGKLKVNRQSVEVAPNKEKVKDAVEYSQLRVPYGKRAFLKLSDGTSLWINSGSTVVYPSAFAQNKREIYVEGEIFADVSRDESRPFIVTTNKLDIQVLGTTFNVSAYKEEKTVNVVLVSGSVDVKPKNGKTTRIKPSQLFTLAEDQTATLKTVDVENYISWRDGKYIFHNEPIENILLRLSRYYNVTMVLPTSVSGITCSGKLELKEDLNRLLNGLSEITSMTYANKDNEYRIRFE